MATTLLQRIITGDGMRRSRFHTQAGEFVDLRGLQYLPHCLWSVVLLKLGHRQEIPWLGFRVLRRLDGLIRPDWKVFESGSGMSSLFFASRCAQLVSVESEKDWYELLRIEFAKRRISNIDYRHRVGDEYARLDDFPDGTFDFALVDGTQRDRVARTAVQKVRPGGWLMMDNSDVPWADHASARAHLVAAAEPGSAEVYRDLCPFGVQACESILVRKRGS
jgi:hypothetical protein